MRLLHVIASLDPRGGGPAAGVGGLVPHYLARGADVDIVTLDGPALDHGVDGRARVHALGPGLGRFGYAPRLRRWLLAHATDYDAVIVDGLWQYHAVAAWLALRGGPTPYFVFPHGMLDPWFKRTYPLKHVKKWGFWQIFQGPALRAAAAVLFTTEEERLLARESFRPYRVRERVVGYGACRPPNAAQAQREAFLSSFPRLRGRRLVLFLGRIHPKKGGDLLLQGFARVAAAAPELDVVMAGPDAGGERARLESLALRLGVADRVHWTGMLAGELKWGALRAAEVFALPSHQENFGVAVVEALACGVPVLVSDKVNIWREVVEDGCGIVASDKVEGVVTQLQEWLALSADARRAMSERACRAFESRFEIGSLAERLLDLAGAARGGRHLAVERS
jgi:glycosyltransferase involved in cell wall biosynthesis